MAVTKRTFIIAAALALLIAAGLPSSWGLGDLYDIFFGRGFNTATQPVACVGSSRDPNWWLSLAWVALMVGVVFQAMLSILSGVLGGQKYNEFFKGGVWGIVETAGMLSIFTLGFAGLGEFGTKNIDTARAYSAIIRNNIMLDFGAMVTSSTVFSFVARQTPPIRMPAVRVFGMGFQLSPMFRPIFDALGLMVQLLAAAIAEWSGQEIFLCFIKTNMLAVIIPIGFFLRAFGLRGGGNALLAIGITLYFIYPYLMTTFGEMITNYVVNDSGLNAANSALTSCVNKPICCLGSQPTQPDMSKAFVKNGPNWATDYTQRLDVEAIIKGDALTGVDFPIAPVIGPVVGSTCFYNTGLANAYSQTIGRLEGWGVVGVGGGLLFGVPIGNYLSKRFNLSFLMVSLVGLFGTFVLYSAYEITFVLFIVSLVVPILLIFITITAAKEIAKALGTEIDLSSLEKLI
ncbi:MAG: hypothetical protein QW568_01725 [Candidatus Anstonellaceae archaeon]